MCQRNLARFRYRAAADQSGLRDGVVRRFEWPLGDQTAASRQTGDGMDPGYLERLFKLERRQDRRQTLCQHCLARTRRADEKNVVAAGAGYFQSAFGGLLAANLAKVKLVLKC